MYPNFNFIEFHDKVICLQSNYSIDDHIELSPFNDFSLRDSNQYAERRAKDNEFNALPAIPGQ